MTKNHSELLQSFKGSCKLKNYKNKLFKKIRDVTFREISSAETCSKFKLAKREQKYAPERLIIPTVSHG